MQILVKPCKLRVPVVRVKLLVWKQNDGSSCILHRLADVQCWLPTGLEAPQYLEKAVQ